MRGRAQGELQLAYGSLNSGATEGGVSTEINEFRGCPKVTFVVEMQLPLSVPRQMGPIDQLFDQKRGDNRAVGREAASIASMRSCRGWMSPACDALPLPLLHSPFRAIFVNYHEQSYGGCLCLIFNPLFPPMRTPRNSLSAPSCWESSSASFSVESPSTSASRPGL